MKVKTIERLGNKVYKNNQKKYAVLNFIYGLMTGFAVSFLILSILVK